MNTTNFKEFESIALAQGFDAALERHWEPNVVVADHVHPFAAKAVVVQGEMWLTVGTDTRHLRAGDGFELEAQVLHSERYGREGATYWVARRNAAAAVR